MVKNALQAQLLKAGLVDNKKAKKLSKQAVHEQRTGQSSEAEIKAKIAQDKQPTGIDSKNICQFIDAL